MINIKHLRVKAIVELRFDLATTSHKPQATYSQKINHLFTLSHNHKKGVFGKSMTHFVSSRCDKVPCTLVPLSVYATKPQNIFDGRERAGSTSLKILFSYLQGH